MLGSSDAKQILLFFFDYTCETCRRLHAMLIQAMKEAPESFAVMLAPVPSDPACNPYTEKLLRRHAGACEYASLALEVWKAKPSLFNDYDEFLCLDPQPPSVALARGYAQRLLNGLPMAPETSDSISAGIKHAVSLHRDLGLTKTPALILSDVILKGSLPSVEALTTTLQGRR